MTGAEWIALTSVTVSGVTALGAPWLSSRMTTRHLSAQTRFAREDELRTVLEDAAVRLTKALQRLDAEVARGDLQQRDHPAVHANDPEELWRTESRIAVRLGATAPETAAYRDAVEGLMTARLQGPTNDGAARFFAAHAALDRFLDLAARRLDPDAP